MTDTTDTCPAQWKVKTTEGKASGFLGGIVHRERWKQQ